MGYMLHFMPIMIHYVTVQWLVWGGKARAAYLKNPKNGVMQFKKESIMLKDGIFLIIL